MKTLRLLLWPDCNRNCEGCCNKQWDLEALPVCEDYSPYEMIILTGGELLLYPASLIEIVKFIRRKNSKAKIIVYTADPSHKFFPLLWDLTDGITLTLHDKSDVADFLNLDEQMNLFKLRKKKSLRLNIFKEVGEVEVSDLWTVKKNIEWIENCPLPPNEVFMRFA